MRIKHLPFLSFLEMLLAICRAGVNYFEVSKEAIFQLGDWDVELYCYSVQAKEVRAFCFIVLCYCLVLLCDKAGRYMTPNTFPL